MRSFPCFTVERVDSAEGRTVFLFALCRIIVGVRGALRDSFANIRDLRVSLISQLQHISRLVLFVRSLYLSCIALFLAESPYTLQVHDLVLSVHV